ncbi:MAG: putative lipid II flippase FtsW [Planctomycetota bacterium]|jgi:cell division protein FtsW|nr:putative lipid II flippase FtsW [Planctomycetota bacterium]
MRDLSRSEGAAADSSRCRARLLTIVLSLTCFGIIMVYSASAVRSGRGNGWEAFYAWNQLSWLIAALAALAVMAAIPHNFWRRLGLPILILCLALLFLVLTPLGTRVNGANRWFRFSFFNVQPSELAKLGMIVVLAAFLAGVKDGRPRFFRHVLPLFSVSGLAVGLIAMEPDFGTASLLGAVLVVLMFAGGVRAWQLFLLLAPALPAAGWYGFTHFDHISGRIDAWLEGTAFHTNVSKLAIGSGGIWGVGLGQGPAKLDYLPEAHTDFILAVIGQEIGLIGTLSLVALFVALVWQGMAVAARAGDRFGSLLAFGITVVIGGQAAFNMGVATGLLPPKGISLPFISFGGSGLVVFYSMIGLMLSLARPASPPIRAKSDPGEKYRPLPAFKTAAPLREGSWT